jgi:hypothetical protein
MLIGTISVVAVLLAIMILQFFKEVNESILLSGAIIFLIFSLLGAAYYLVTKQYERLRDNATSFLPLLLSIYMIFFSIMAFEYNRAPFLTIVRDGIRAAMD